MSTEPEFPRVRSSMHHTGDYHEKGYTVEARCTLREPRSVGPILLGQEWAEVPFNRSPQGGIPMAHPYSPLPMMSVMSWPAAQALRWWFHAEAASTGIMSDLGIETRIIEHAIKLEYECRAVGPVDEVTNGSSRRLPPLAASVKGAGE